MANLAGEDLGLDSVLVEETPHEEGLRPAPCQSDVPRPLQQNLLESGG